jgi:hypothetical protein
VEHLHLLERGFLPLHRQDDVENSQWLELLRQFTAVKTLYLSKEFVPRFGPFTQELVEGSMTEVLSALQNLFLEELHPSGLRTNPGSHLEIRCRTMALESSYRHFSLGERI